MIVAGQTDENLTNRVFLPRPPAAPAGKGFTDLLRGVLAVFQFIPNLVRALEDNGNKVHRTVNEMTNRGDDLVAASTLELSARIHSVSGTGTITTLAASPGFRGWAYLVSLGGGWSLAPGGNIAATASPSDGSMLPVLYDPATETWYPSASAGTAPPVSYVIRGKAMLVGTRDGANTTFILPNSDEFYLDAHGSVFGILFLNANPLSPTDVAPTPGAFEYQRTSLTTVELGIAPDANDDASFYNLLVVA